MTDDQDLQFEAQQANAAATAAQPRQAIPTTVVNQPPPQSKAPPRAMDTPWTPAQDAQPFTMTPDAATQPQGKSSSLWGTVGEAAWQATKEMGSDALAAASFTARHALNDPAIVGYIEDARHKLDANIQSTLESMPADRQQAMHASIFGGTDEQGNHIPTPGEVGWKQYAAATLGSFIPDIALAVAPEAVASRLAIKLGMEGAAKAAGMAATGAAFGTDQAGGAYKTLVDTVDHTSDAEMMQNPTYAHLRQDQGMDEQTAKSKLVGSPQVTALIAAQFGVGAVTGAGTGQLITHGAMGAAEKGLAGRAGIGAAEGAATMGIQGSAGDYLRQQANMTAGPQKEYDPTQTAQALVSGALGGALMGTFGGAIHSEKAPEQPKPVENTTSLPDDAHAAMRSALQLDLPGLDNAGPGAVKGSDQSQLFRTTQEANPPGGASVQPSAPVASSSPTAPVNSPNPASQGDMFPTQPGKMSVTTPEPNSDVQAQIAALADPNNPKDAVFLAKGTPLPGNLPEGAKVVVRKVGTLITTNADKAKNFRGSALTDNMMASILGYPQTKADALASGNPKAVQGRDAQGNVVHESLVSPDAMPAAQAAAQAQVPGGTVHTLTPEEVQARRAGMTSDTLTSDHPVDVAAHQAVDPTAAQAEAGNYQKGHVSLHGLDISVENPKGSIRRGPTDPTTGMPAWQTEMPAHYGYVKGSRGADGDHVDVSLGSRTKAMFDGTPGEAAKEPVFVIDQIDPKTGKFDEHKAMVGFHTQVEAERAYDHSFSDGSGPSRRGATNEMEFGNFKTWLDKGNTKQAISYKEPTVGDKLKAKRAAEKAKQASDPTGLNKITGAMPADGDLKAVGKALPAMAEKVRKMFAESQAKREAAGLPAETFDEFHARTLKEKAAPAPVETDPVKASKNAEAEFVKQAIAGKAEWATKRKAMIKEASASGASTDQVMALISKAETEHRATNPEHYMSDDQLKQVASHLETMDDITPADILKADQSARNGELAFDHGARTKKKPMSADLEDKMGESDGRLDADELQANVKSDDAALDSAATGKQFEDTTVGKAGEEMPEESSEGLVQDYGAEKERSAQTSNLERTLSDLEHKITQGQLSPAEADQRYGTHDGKTGAEKRTLKDWLQHQITKRDNPETEKSAVLDAAAKMQDKSLTAAQKKSLGNKLKAELAKYDPDYVNRLRDALDELTATKAAVPEREALAAKGDALADEAEKLLPHVLDIEKANNWLGGTKKDGSPRDGALTAALKHDIGLMRDLAAEHRAGGNKLMERVTDRRHSWRSGQYSWEGDKYGEKGAPSSPQMRAMVDRFETWIEKAEDDAFKTPDGKTHSREITPAIQYQRDVNSPAASAGIDRLLHADKPSNLHQYLDAIIGDKDLQKVAGPMVALARRLKMLAPDIQVMSHEQAADRFGMNYLRLGDAGTFQEARGGAPSLISLHTNAPDSRVETVLHETLHAVTSRYIERLPDNSPDRLALNAMHDELSKLLDNETLSDRERGELEYALQDPHELHTMLMSNPTVQRLAANHIPGPDFVKRMNSLGYVGQAARAVWSYFTSFIRRALGMSDEGNMPMLDHILRPLQDITDRAAKFNAGETVSADSLTHSLPDFSKLKDNVVDKVDPAGLPDRARKMLLPGATTDGIVKWNKDLFKGEDGNKLVDYRTANEAIAHRTAAHHDKFADRVKELIGQIQGKERDKIASLLVDATTADAKVGRKLDPDANSHLKDLTQQRALQTRFNALSDAGKTTYEAIRDYHKQVYAIERDAQLRSMVKTAIPDATPEQTKRIAEAAKTKAGIEKLIAGADTDPVAQAFGDAWSGRRAIVQGIAKVHRQGFVQGDYFPLRRFGDYVVTYGEKGEDSHGVEMFDSASKAQARRDELAKQNVAGLSPVMEKRSSKLRDAMSTTVVDEMAAAMKQNPDLAEHAGAMRDLVSSIQLQHATRSEQARTRMRRQGVKGASTDVEKVMAQDFLSTATRLGYLEHGVDRTQALAGMQRHVDLLGRTTDGDQQRRAQQVLNELQRRTPSGDDASSTLSNIARKFSALGFVQSLMSPSHMITSSIEAHMNSTSLLGARHGAIQSGVALARALKDITPSMAMAGAKNTVAAVGKGLKANDWNLSNVVRDKLIAGGADKGHMTKLFGALNQAGLIDHSMVREMQRIANPGSDITRGWWQRFMDMNSAGSHAVDVANKSAIAKAAFDLELRKTGDAGKAVDYALETVRQSTPNYNLANKARIATDKGVLGGFAGPLTQFKNYGIHMYSMMANLTKESIHGASRDDRMEARKAMAGILITHAMMAGSLTLIGDPLRWIGGAYDWISGADKPHDYENDVRRWAADAMGPTMGELFTRGLPQALGIDIHRRVGLANLLEPPELNSFDKKGFQEAVVAAMTGAAGDDAMTMAAGLTKMLHGDIMGGLQSIVPRVLRDPMKAAKLANTGVTDTKGKVILPASKISSGAVAAQAVGFNPSEVSEFREGRAAVMEAKQEAGSERQKLMSEMVSKSGGDRSDLLDQMRAFNHANPGEPITYSQIIQAQVRQRKAAMTPASPGSFGVQMKPKVAATLSKAGAFANVQ